MERRSDGKHWWLWRVLPVAHIRILCANAQSFIADLAIAERRTAICGCNAGCSAITQELVSIRLLQCLSLPLIVLC